MSRATVDDLKDVLDFIASVIPFSTLDEHARLILARQLEIEYIPKQLNHSLAIEACVYIVRTGAFEILDDNKKLVDRLGEGECFGVTTLLHDNPEHLQVIAIEDALVYRLNKDDFLTLLDQHRNIRLFFTKLAGYRTASPDALIKQEALSVQHTRAVKYLIQNKLVYCDQQTSIREAAEIMRENRVSCLLLLEEKNLVGIITDRDLRNRVVAEALDVNRLASEIATLNPAVVLAQSSMIEAQLHMSSVGIHHLPVVENNKPIGVITASDIIRAHSVSIIHFVDRIFRESEIDSLATLFREIPGLLDYWIQVDVSPQEIGQSFAVISDAFVRRSIQLALEIHGQPPMAFVWLAFGSQARKDQSFSSDQDSGLILAHEPNPDEADYFSEFTATVCQFLDQIGYPLCPGNIMASNSRWRKTLTQWLDVFVSWIHTPNPESLLNATVFFDVRAVFGPAQWLETLKEDLSREVKTAEIFLMHLTANALHRKPPLGFFRAFMVNHSGDHEHELDIKQQGIALVNDMARILALAEGCLTAQTLTRLEQVTDQLLQAPLRESLKEAWLQLNELKLEYQCEQLKTGLPASNFINPDDLSPLRRAQLKSAFKVIERAQQALAQHYLRGSRV
jgi:CBS domain-containing protein